MNPNFTQMSPAELEERITALLMGELDSATADALRALLQRDAELARWADRLSRTLELVQEAEARPVADSPAGTGSGVVPNGARMSEARREALLRQLRGSGADDRNAVSDSGAESVSKHTEPSGPENLVTVRFPAPGSSDARGGSWLALAAAAVAVLGLVAVLLGEPSAFQPLRQLARSNAARVADVRVEEDVRQGVTVRGWLGGQGIARDKAQPAEDETVPITLSGADQDGEPLTYAITTPPSPGVLAGTAPSPAEPVNAAPEPAASASTAPAPFMMSPQLMKRYGLAPSGGPQPAADSLGRFAGGAVNGPIPAPARTPFAKPSSRSATPSSTPAPAPPAAAAIAATTASAPAAAPASVNRDGRVLSESLAQGAPMTWGDFDNDGSTELFLNGGDVKAFKRRLAVDAPAAGVAHDWAMKPQSAQPDGGLALGDLPALGQTFKAAKAKADRTALNAGRPAALSTAPVGSAGDQGRLETYMYRVQPEAFGSGLAANGAVAGDSAGVGGGGGGGFGGGGGAGGVAGVPVGGRTRGTVAASAGSATAGDTLGVASARGSAEGAGAKEPSVGRAQSRFAAPKLVYVPSESSRLGAQDSFSMAVGDAKGAAPVQPPVSVLAPVMADALSPEPTSAAAPRGALAAESAPVTELSDAAAVPSTTLGFALRHLEENKNNEPVAPETLRAGLEVVAESRLAERSEGLSRNATTAGKSATLGLGRRKDEVQGGSAVATNAPVSSNGTVSFMMNDGSVSITLADTEAVQSVTEEARSKKVEALADAKRELDESKVRPVEVKIVPPAPVPQPEQTTAENAFSTFSMNVSDVSFRLAAASLENGALPAPGSIRSEEFVNAFTYRDPDPAPGVPLAFAWERARYPFAHNRDVLRLAVRTASVGREPGRALNLVLVLDNSGSMERADRVATLREALRVLAGQLQPNDRISVVAFARTARLWVDALPGARAGELVGLVGNLVPEGGTNLEDALRVAYETALKHFLAEGANRVVLLTDGAANLGNVDPESLKQMVESHRRRGVALDCFGIGWEGYNDDLLEVLTRNGDGRYGFVNTPEEAATGFADQLAGALQVAAADVKVQVEFNPQRVPAWRQIGYARHQLTKEQFRDNTVDAAEIGAAESGNALYIIETNPRGEGPVATVRVRFRVPSTGLYEEHAWTVPYTGGAPGLREAAPTLRLASASAAFSEWLAGSPFGAEARPSALLEYLVGVPGGFLPDPRPARLEEMIRRAQSLSGQ